MKHFQARKRRGISWFKELDYLLSIGRQEFAGYFEGYLEFFAAFENFYFLIPRCDAEALNDVVLKFGWETIQWVCVSVYKMYDTFSHSTGISKKKFPQIRLLRSKEQLWKHSCMSGLILLSAAVRIGGLLDFNFELLSDYKKSCKVPYAILHYLSFCRNLFFLSLSLSLFPLFYSPICRIQRHVVPPVLSEFRCVERGNLTEKALWI